MAFDDTEDAAIPEAAEYTAGSGAPAAPQPAADDSGAAPVAEAIPTDDSGAAPVVGGAATPQAAPAEQQGGAPKRFGPLGRIVSYLMGEGADNPAVLEQSAAAADPQRSMPRGDANLLAIEAAAAKGGDEAAWKLLQANRVAYNAKQAFGYAALNGTQQKRPDINAAVDAANQAADHVLDGQNVKFMASQAGQITATVTPSGGGEPQIFDLTPEQFRKYLTVGGDGQWDKVMQNKIPGTLQKIISGAGQQRSAPPPARQRSVGDTMQAQQAPQAGAEAPASNETNFGKTPSSMNLSGSDQRSQPAEDKTNYGEELEARAMRMFPSVSQQHQRDTWMAGQEEAEAGRTNKIEVAKQTGASRVSVAQENGAARRDVEFSKSDAARDVAETKRKGWEYASDAKKAAAQIAADQKAAHEGNVDARARIESARKAIATKRMTAGELSPEDKALEGQLVSQAGQRPAAAAPQQQAAPKPQAPGPAPVQGARFFNGQWYTRGSNGEAVPYRQ